MIRIRQAIYNFVSRFNMEKYWRRRIAVQNLGGGAETILPCLAKASGIEIWKFNGNREGNESQPIMPFFSSALSSPWFVRYYSGEKYCV